MHFKFSSSCNNKSNTQKHLIYPVTFYCVLTPCVECQSTCAVISLVS